MICSIDDIGGINAPFLACLHCHLKRAEVGQNALCTTLESFSLWTLLF